MKATAMDAAEIQRVILERLSKYSAFKAVICVSVDTYPDEVFASVWLGQHLNDRLRHDASQLEDELRELGIPCTILLKNEKDLRHGITWKLRTRSGEFPYRAYRVDPIGDEDWVFVFAVYQGETTIRFRVSMTRTLASMLRSKGLLDDRRILSEYALEIAERLDSENVDPEKLHEIMLSSHDSSRFTKK